MKINMIHLKTVPLQFLFILIFSIFFQSCNYFTEPNPTANNNVTPQEIKPLLVSNYREGDTVTAAISIELQPTEELSEIDYAIVMNDSTTFPKISQPPFLFDIDTRWWLNGTHNLTIGLYKKDYNPGLFRLQNEPSVKYTIRLVFKHQPLPPQIYGFVRRTYTSGSAEVSWRQYLATDTQYFVVQFFDKYGTDSVFLTDTLRSNDANSYSAQIKEDVLYFRVGAGNEYGISYSGPKYLVGTN